MKSELSLPTGWKTVKLGEICKQSRTTLDPLLTTARSLPYIGLEHVESNSGRILSMLTNGTGSEVRSTTFAFDSSHVLYGKLRPYLNKVALPDFVGRCSTEIIPLLPRDDVDRQYLALLLRLPSTVEAAMRDKTGSRMPRADMSSLMKHAVPLPPLPEQKRIAAILNEQLAAVEKARKAAEAELEAARALPTAYLRQVFNSDEAKKWDTVPFGDMATLQRGYDLPSQDQVTGPYPIITSSGEMGRHAEYAEVGPGVVTGRSGSIGKVYYTEENYWPHNTALFIKDFKGCAPKFIYYLLTWMDLKRVCSGSGVPTLDRKQVHKVIVPRPPVDVQERIATTLDAQTAGASALVPAVANHLKYVSMFPSSILRKAFRGEL